MLYSSDIEKCRHLRQVIHRTFHQDQVDQVVQAVQVCLAGQADPVDPVDPGDLVDLLTTHPLPCKLTIGVIG
ncbi:hypothetical protein K1T71_001225 [Dendrolimus kikuchii]|uniref:Uncharacterized protein n=1 Tax=Dendrolimus kikuchii TaxID=765133 RepID=A0ACC1DHL5_9NEOP|nr:hypothetical protein K1T71_001225 [Dendrolimus kikuchii]